jgi:uncharacterized protein (TIGR02145 family)
MKSTSGWSENGNGDNSSGFSGLPGGFRFYVGSFGNIGNDGDWWGSTEYDTYYAYGRHFSRSDGNLSSYYGGKEEGLSVRCLRD